MKSLVRAEQQGNVLRLALDDDATRNSLSEAMMGELQSKLEDAGADRNVHVIVIASTGKVFSSGHNLKELTSHRLDPDKGEAYFEQVFSACARLMLTVSLHRCAIIAEIDGLASAAGCQLVASCDLAFASPRAGFCTPGVNLGLFCSTPMVPISRNMPSKLAMEMLLTGDVKDADFALRAGLINSIVPQNDLTSQVMGMGLRIAEKSQAALYFGKRAYHDQRHLSLTGAYELTAGIMVRNMLDGAACEGLDAFLNKRKPAWPELS